MLRQIRLKGEDRIAISGPYNPRFNTRARHMGAKWENASGAGKAWCFPDGATEAALAAAKSVYGVTPASQHEPKYRNVKLLVRSGWKTRKGPVTLLGYELAIARGRDSGARPGSGVMILSGTVTSSGSDTNWYSTVETGVIALLLDMPLSWMPALKRETDVQILAVTPFPDADVEAPPSPATDAAPLTDLTPELRRATALALIDTLHAQGMTADLDVLTALIRPLKP